MFNYLNNNYLSHYALSVCKRVNVKIIFVIFLRRSGNYTAFPQLITLLHFYSYENNTFQCFMSKSIKNCSY